MTTQLPYHQLIIEHYHKPRNRGKLATATHASSKANPACGDRVAFYAQVVDGRITAISFEGEGCMISQAVASMITELVQGKPLQDIQSVAGEHLLGVWGMSLGPSRKRCATLVFDAVGELRASC